jgi:hypothetical protein
MQYLPHHPLAYCPVVYPNQAGFIAVLSFCGVVLYRSYNPFADTSRVRASSAATLVRPSILVIKNIFCEDTIALSREGLVSFITC